MVNQTNDEIQAKVAEALRHSVGEARRSGLAGYGELGLAVRTPLRDRVAGQLQSAEHQAGKACRLDELLRLLDKNPDVARILDLMEEVRA